MANFTYTCHRCVPDAPSYNVLETEMEGMRIKTRIKTTDPERSWTLEFHGQTLIERNALLTHFKGQYANGVPFYWTNLPSWIFTVESSIYVRYKSYKEDVIGQDIWDITLEFKEVLLG